MREQQLVVCRDSAPEYDCDWEARDSDEVELLESARTHIRRRHALERTPAQLRPLLRTAVRGVGGI